MGELSSCAREVIEPTRTGHEDAELQETLGYFTNASLGTCFILTEVPGGPFVLTGEGVLILLDVAKGGHVLTDITSDLSGVEDALSGSCRTTGNNTTKLTHTLCSRLQGAGEIVNCLLLTQLLSQRLVTGSPILCDLVRCALVTLEDVIYKVFSRDTDILINPFHGALDRVHATTLGYVLTGDTARLNRLRGLLCDRLFGRLSTLEEILSGHILSGIPLGGVELVEYLIDVIRHHLVGKRPPWTHPQGSLTLKPPVFQEVVCIGVAATLVPKAPILIGSSPQSSLTSIGIHERAIGIRVAALHLMHHVFELVNL